MEIAVGVTTAPRSVYYLPRTLESLFNAGWSEPTIFAEPNSRCDEIPPSVRWVQHQKHLGAFGNWRCALRHLLESHKDAHAIMLVQDDVVFPRNASKLLESVLWPSARAGCVSLYCSAKFATGTGLHRENRPKFFGACALVFPRSVAESIAMSNQIDYKSPARKIDLFVSEVIASLGFEFWCFSPSLCQHIGETSSDFLRPLGHGGASGNLSASDFVGEDCDVATAGYPCDRKNLVAINKVS